MSVRSQEDGSTCHLTTNGHGILERDKLEHTPDDLGTSAYSQDELDALPRELTFRWYDVLGLIYSIFSYLIDTTSDIAVAYLLYEAGKNWYFGLTVAFVVIPTLTMTGFSLKWYVADSKLEGSPPTNRKIWSLRIFLLLLQLGPALRYMDSLKFGIMFRKTGEIKYYKLMTFEDADAAMLRLFEAFMEAAPQLILQIYILAGDTIDDEMTVMVQLLSCAVSLCSLAWSLAAQHRAMRISLKDSKNMSWPGTIVQALWFLFMIGSRMLTVGLFASRFPIHLAVICAFRWVVMTTWLHTMKTEFCDTKIEEFFYRCALGVVFLFCYFNPENTATRWRYFFFYLYTLTENAILIGVWYAWMEPDHWYKLSAVITVFLSFFIGLLFMVIYYLLLHPTENIQIFAWCTADPKEQIQDDDCLSTPDPMEDYPSVTENGHSSSPLRELKSPHPLNLVPASVESDSQVIRNRTYLQEGEDEERLQALAEVYPDRSFGTPV